MFGVTCSQLGVNTIPPVKNIGSVHLVPVQSMSTFSHKLTSRILVLIGISDTFIFCCTELQEIKKDDIQLIDEGQVQKTVERAKNNGINIEEIQQYANSMGESLTIDDINYGLMYGRSVIADFCV